MFSIHGKPFRILLIDRCQPVGVIVSMRKVALAELLFLHLVLKYQKLLYFQEPFIHLAGGQYFRISSNFSLLILAKRNEHCILHWSSRGVNGWHLSIGRILNGFPKAWKHYFTFLKKHLFRTFNNITFDCKKSSILALLRTSLPTKKWYLFAPFMRSLESDKKVREPLSRFKSSFGKVRIGWRADLKIFTRKLKIPDFFFKTRYLFLTFNLNDKQRQKKVTILYVVLRKMNAETYFSWWF